ncbi:MAG: dihydrodipicolinate synthase family protein [Pirellulaceae bacterium]
MTLWPNSAETPRLQGIVPPLVTPLSRRDEIDVVGTVRLLNHVIEGGVSGVFILGTTGEAPSLSYRLRRKFIRLVCETVSDRVPVLVGITDTAFIESIALAQVASESGAGAVVLSAPYYFPAGQTELTRYVESILAQISLPLMLYNMPSLTKVAFDIGTVEKLFLNSQIVGVKDSGGDMEYFGQLLKLKKMRPDWSILIGPEHLMAEAVILGADGGVNGGANIYPQLFVDLYRAAAARDEPRIEALGRVVTALQDIYAVGKYASRFIKATKCALSLHDICSDYMSDPFNHFLPPERAKVAAILDGLPFHGVGE